MHATTIYVPLNKLQISPLNARRTDATAVDELAALIKSQGLLQNLIVVPGNATDGSEYGVIAGGRRLRALKLLATQGDLEADYPVPCLPKEAADAEEASVAENSGREPMHPADEFEAFKRWHDRGLPIEDVAAKFGVSPVVVQRRLKLANVSPDLIELYRAGEMKLDQVTALSITDDHKLQLKTWRKADGWQRNADRLRAALMDGMVSTQNDHAAKFIGISAYESAGGQVVRDLFAGPDDGYMKDRDLLSRLFEAKLEAIAAEIRAEGWAWVEARPSISSNDTYRFGKSNPTTRELTEEEAESVQRLASQIADLRARLEAGEDDESVDGALLDELDAQADLLEAERTEIQARTKVYSDRQKQKAGVLIGLNYYGSLEIHRGLIREVDKPKASPAEKPKEGAKAAHSESLVRRLSAHRTAALQASLADCPRLALSFLCCSLADSVFYHSVNGDASAIRISADPRTASLTQHADDVEGARAWTCLQETHASLRALMPDSADELLAWCEEQTVERLLEVLAFVTATCIDAVQHQESNHLPAAAIARELGLDMSGFWEATASSYFKHVRKDVAIAAVVDAGGPEAATPLEGMKKAQIDVQAEQLLEDTGWLPSMLRSPDAPPKKATKPVVAKKAAAKKAPPAKKAAAKKGAPKKTARTRA